MSKTPIPSAKYFEMKRKHEDVKALLASLERKHLGKNSKEKRGWWARVLEIIY